MRQTRPPISVIVASQNAGTTVRECLTLLVDQQAESQAEIVLVDNSTDGTTQIIREVFPRLPLITCPPSLLIPELWEIGIRQTDGDVVALLTAHCVPHEQWLTRIIKAHEAPVAAVGGAIEHDSDAGVIPWAVYFCRYSRFMLPFTEAMVEEIPGDNASYKRADLDRCVEARQDGFWEPSIHAELRRAGRPILLTPSIVVYHRQSFGVWAFMRQRFMHGRRFGQWRASRLTPFARWMYLACSPVIPLVLLARIARQVMAKGRHRVAFCTSLPLQILFLLAWTVGEVRGIQGGRVS